MSASHPTDVNHSLALLKPRGGDYENDRRSKVSLEVVDHQEQPVFIN